MPPDDQDESRGKPDLRLVARPRAKGASAPTAIDRAPRAPPDTKAVFFVSVKDMESDVFFPLLEGWPSSVVVDVRAVPRFDVIAHSRRYAFKCFQRMEATYIDLFGRLGIRSYSSEKARPARWAAPLYGILKNIERKGSCVFLFDHDDLMRAAQETLPDLVRAIVGDEVRFTTIPKAMLAAVPRIGQNVIYGAWPSDETTQEPGPEPDCDPPGP